jgi:hypothetical protein
MIIKRQKWEYFPHFANKLRFDAFAILNFLKMKDHFICADVISIIFVP